MQDKQPVRLSELRRKALEAIEEKGLSQSAVARTLKVDRSTVHRALTEEGAGYVEVLRRIIALTTDFEVEEEPLFRVKRKP